MKSNQTTTMSAAINKWLDNDNRGKNEYYFYCCESYLNGQIQQSKDLFKDMPYENRQELIDYIRVNFADDKMNNFFVNLFS